VVEDALGGGGERQAEGREVDGGARHAAADDHRRVHLGAEEGVQTGVDVFIN